jgi:hypothetical protein
LVLGSHSSLYLRCSSIKWEVKHDNTNHFILSQNANAYFNRSWSTFVKENCWYHCLKENIMGKFNRWHTDTDISESCNYQIGVYMLSLVRQVVKHIPKHKLPWHAVSELSIVRNKELSKEQCLWWNCGKWYFQINEYQLFLWSCIEDTKNNRKYWLSRYDRELNDIINIAHYCLIQHWNMFYD